MTNWTQKMFRSLTDPTDMSLFTPERTRETFIPQGTTLNGMPWATIVTETDMPTIRRWVDAGLELGVLLPSNVDDEGDTVFLQVGDRIINFTPQDTFGQFCRDVGI